MVPMNLKGLVKKMKEHSRELSSVITANNLYQLETGGFETFLRNLKAPAGGDGMTLIMQLKKIAEEKSVMVELKDPIQLYAAMGERLIGDTEEIFELTGIIRPYISDKGMEIRIKDPDADETYLKYRNLYAKGIVGAALLTILLEKVEANGGDKASN